MRPNYIERTANKLQRKFKNGIIERTAFLEEYSKFKTVLFVFAKDFEIPSSKIHILAKEAYERDYLTEKEYRTVLECNKIRNLIAHSTERIKIDKKQYNDLSVITEKFKTKMGIV